MASAGVYYQINGQSVPAPDEEQWAPIEVGVALTGEQRRSPFRRLEWRKRVADQCRLEDWIQFDNTILDSLVCRPPDGLDQHERYTDVICQSVTATFRHHVGMEIVAVFLVNVEAVS